MTLPFLLCLMASDAWESEATPFRDAALEAGGIVRARLAMDEKSPIFLEVVEVLVGRDVPKQLIVSKDIWRVWAPRDLPPGQVTYLLLLRQGEELLCGHMNGLVLLDDGCIGILPVVDGAIPKQFAKLYDGTTAQAIPLKRVREEVRAIERTRH